MRLPSGDHWGSLSFQSLPCVIGLASPDAAAGVGPATGFGDAAGAGADDSPGRDERNAIDFPSGLQRGELEDCGEVVNCQGARLPSVAAIQIAELRRFCARSILVMT